MRWSVFASACLALAALSSLPAASAAQTPEVDSVGSCEYLQPTDAPDMSPIWLSDYGVTVDDFQGGGTGLMKCFVDPWGIVNELLRVVPDPPCDLGDPTVTYAAAAIAPCGVGTGRLVEQVRGLVDGVRCPEIQLKDAFSATAFSVC